MRSTETGEQEEEEEEEEGEDDTRSCIDARAKRRISGRGEKKGVEIRNIRGEQTTLNSLERRVREREREKTSVVYDYGYKALSMTRSTVD